MGGKCCWVVACAVMACGDNTTVDPGHRVVGLVYADADADRTQDPGEGGLGGFTMFLDLDGNGALDAGEPMTVTAADGSYELTAPLPGTYTVRQQMPFGFRASPPQAKPRRTSIIGGGDTAAGEYGFMVGVGVLFDGAGFQFCGGALISDRHVITAAHCSAGEDPSEVAVIAGSLEAFTEEPLLVDSIKLHPSFEGNTEAGFDIALWTLAEPVDLAALELTTVELLTPDHAALEAPGALATTLGWGVSDRASNQLQFVHVPLVDAAACADVYPEATNFETQICAGATEGGIDSCQGDSGGPLLVRDPARDVWMHAGVTSWGDGCALPGTPGIYARTSALSDWVFGEARESGASQTVTVDGTATADFPTVPTTRAQAGAIAPRWQLTGMALPDEVAADTPVDASWRILGESPGLTGFQCTFDPDGPGAAAPQDIPCSVGATEVNLPGFPTGIFPARLDVTGPGASFTRRSNIFVGTPLATPTGGALAATDPLDPDYFDPYFVDYFAIGALSGTRAFAIELRSSEFAAFLTLYDADARDPASGGGILAFGNFIGNDTMRLVVVPEPGVRYLVGVSSFAPQATGDYTVSIINDGTLTATQL